MTSAEPPPSPPASPTPPTEEEKSKDLFFQRVGDLAQDMIEAHGREFTMGTLVLAARFIADGKPIGRPGRRQN